MAILSINKQYYEENIKSSEGITLIDFYAEWCGPCKMIAPAIEEIANENPDITVVKVNVDTATDLAIDFKVSVIPTLAVVKDGRVLSTSTGYRSKEQILSLLGK